MDIVIYDEPEREFTFNYFSHQYDNVVNSEKKYNWGNLVAAFSTHLYAPEKKTIMFIPGSFVNQTAKKYKPAYKYLEQHEDGTWEKEEKRDATGKPLVGRYSENITFMEGMVLEFDGKQIEAVIKMLYESNLQHFGYTCHHHFENSVQQFRVFLPFLEPCSRKQFQQRYLAMKSFIRNANSKFLLMDRPFYMPSCSRQDSDQAYTWHLDGEMLNWRSFKAM